MKEGLEGVGLNATPKTLRETVVFCGEKVDPLSGRSGSRDSWFSVSPTSTGSGVTFKVGDLIIPYDAHHLHAVDTKLGRMLCLRHPDFAQQIMLVEHLLSAINLLGLTDIRVHLDGSTYGRMTSGRLPKFGLNRPTHWIPVVGPGVEGYVRGLAQHAVPLSKTPEVIRVTREHVWKEIDPNPKYGGIERRLEIKPTKEGRLIIRIQEAGQPDIKNLSPGDPICIKEGDDVTSFLSARPVMRIRNWVEEILVFGLNFAGSSMLTHKNYFKSRPKLTAEEITKRMSPQFRKGRNEHFYHAFLDRYAELFAPIGSAHLHAELTMYNMNHVSHMKALRELMPQILGS